MRGELGNTTTRGLRKGAYFYAMRGRVSSLESLTKSLQATLKELEKKQNKDIENAIRMAEYMGRKQQQAA